jgi:hypothetical protein
MEPGESERVHTLLQEISKASSFDEVYRLLGFRYVINPSGTLKPKTNLSLPFSAVTFLST